MNLKYLFLFLVTNLLNAQIITTKEEVIKKIAANSFECTAKKEDLKNTSDFLQKVMIPCVVYSV